MTDLTRVSLLGLVAAGALLGGCNRQPAHDDSAVAGQVRTAARALVDDYNSGNVAAAAAMDAPDYVGMFHGTPNTEGPAADLAGMKAQMASAKVRWQVGTPRVTVASAGDIGIFEAPYTFTVTASNGDTSTESGNWIAIFKRQGDGTLKLWRSIGSDTPAPKP